MTANCIHSNLPGLRFNCGRKKFFNTSSKLQLNINICVKYTAPHSIHSSLLRLRFNCGHKKLPVTFQKISNGPNFVGGADIHSLLFDESHLRVVYTYDLALRFRNNFLLPLKMLWSSIVV